MILLVVVSCYLLGSISFSVIIAKIFTQRDVREHGSGNAGATNVIRSVGVVPGLLTFLFDLLKGVAAVALARWVFDNLLAASARDDRTYLIYAGLAGLFAMIGHIFPVFFRFKGGKAVSTAGGILFMLFPTAFWILLAIFIITLLITRTVSISSITIAVLLPFIEPVLDCTGIVKTDNLLIKTIIAVVFAFIVVIMHRANIKRLIAGEEPKLFSFGKKEKQSV